MRPDGRSRRPSPADCTPSNARPNASAWRISIARNVYSRVISHNWSRVNKRTALQFCIGLQLSREEADILLKSAGYALSETIVEDCIFAYCIEHRIWNLEDINEILAKCGLETIQINKEKQ